MRSPRNTPQSATHALRLVDLRVICSLAIGLIYGQTLGHTLLDYDDSGFVYNCPRSCPV